MLNIALDIDGVVADIQSEFEFRLKQDFKIEIDRQDWKTHWICDQFPEVPRSWVDDQLSDPTFWLNAKCREDAYHMVNKWFMDGNNIFIVTCRNGVDTVRVTERWFSEWELNYNSLHHSETRLNKYRTLLDLDIDIFVEDDPHEVQVASEHVETYLMDHPYNKDYDIGSGVRICSLYELDGRIP